MKDILYFILILVIFTSGFGIAYNTLLSPTFKVTDSTNATWKVALDVFYRPYWQMYGELFLEDIDKGNIFILNLLRQICMILPLTHLPKHVKYDLFVSNFYFMYVFAYVCELYIRFKFLLRAI